MSLPRNGSYRAPAWLPGGHLQTLYSSLFIRVNGASVPPAQDPNAPPAVFAAQIVCRDLDPWPVAQPAGRLVAVDVETGRIIDRSHPDLGETVSGRILVMPGGRGSSSSSSVLAEAVRRGTGPAAIVLAIPDPILTVGAIVAQALYGARCPVVVCSLDGIATGDRLRVSAASGRPARVSAAD